MGKTVSEETKNKKSWDSNAITPGKKQLSIEFALHKNPLCCFVGTPFMDLLASSLRYWVVQKLNSDPAWKAVSSSFSVELMNAN